MYISSSAVGFQPNQPKPNCTATASVERTWNRPSIVLVLPAISIPLRFSSNLHSSEISQWYITSLSKDLIVQTSDHSTSTMMDSARAERELIKGEKFNVSWTLPYFFSTRTGEGGQNFGQGVCGDWLPHRPEAWTEDLRRTSSQLDGSCPRERHRTVLLQDPSGLLRGEQRLDEENCWSKLWNLRNFLFYKVWD